MQYTGRRGRYVEKYDTVGSQAGEVSKRHSAGVPRGKRAQARRRRLVEFAFVCSDVLLAVLVWQVAHELHDVWGWVELSDVAVFSIVPNVVIWVGMRALLGLYPGYGLDAAEELRRQTYAVAYTLGVTTVFAIALHVGDMLSRMLTVVEFAGLALLAPLLRHFVRHALIRLGLWGRSVVILGTGEMGGRVIAALRGEKALGFTPTAVFDDFAPEGDALGGVPYLGALEDAEGLAREYGIDVAIVAMPSRLGEVVDWAGTRFRRVIVLPDLGGVTNSAMVARDLAGIFGVEIKHNLLDPWPRRAKRALDLLGATVGGLLVSPLLLVVALLVKLDSRGPVFYGQSRPGAGGNRFCCWKFRTMVVDADRLLDEYLQSKPELRNEWERGYKLKDDPRITRIGRFLRETSLDELPQLWNVLKGEMSLVGPRPILLAELPREHGKAYPGKVYELYKRVPPGITGLWQVSGRSDTGYEERVAMDAYYVRNWSVWLDLVILARTASAVASRRGAR